MYNSTDLKEYLNFFAEDESLYHFGHDIIFYQSYLKIKYTESVKNFIHSANAQWFLFELSNVIKLFGSDPSMICILRRVDDSSNRFVIICEDFNNNIFHIKNVSGSEVSAGDVIINVKRGLLTMEDQL